MTELSNSLADLAESVKLAIAAASLAERTSIEKALEAGEFLCQAKAACAHGQWLPFLDRAAVPERKAQRFMTLARSGLEIRHVTHLGGIKAALSFLAKWRLPTFDEALFIYDLEQETGERSVGRGIAYVWEDDQHRGSYHIGMIVGDGGDDDEEDRCIATRRPMLPMIEVDGDRPVNTIIHFLTSPGFTLPIGDWQINFVHRRLPMQVLPPFFVEDTFREAAVAGSAA